MFHWFCQHFVFINLHCDFYQIYHNTISLFHHLGDKVNAATTDFSEVLTEELEQQVKAAAEISMGTEVSTEDIDNIIYLCDQVNYFSCLRCRLVSIYFGYSDKWVWSVPVYFCSSKSVFSTSLFSPLTPRNLHPSEQWPPYAELRYRIVGFLLLSLIILQTRLCEKFLHGPDSCTVLQKHLKCENTHHTLKNPFKTFQK